MVKVANRLGVEPTAKLLGVRSSLLMRFIEGLSPVPDRILLKAVDLILDDATPEIPPLAPPAKTRPPG